VAWAALATGAGLGFLARDALDLAQPLVALAWAGGALLGAAFGRRAPRGKGRAHGDPRAAAERGQAAIEWIALLLLVALALAGLCSFLARVDGWSFGGFMAHRLLCSVKGGCADGDRQLARAYGERDAVLVRANSPNLVYEAGERQLPVDWRRCRRRTCADAPDEPGLDVHRSGTGERATVFTHVLRRRRRIYIEYWFYYPDSNTTWAGSDRAWKAAWLIPRLVRIVPRAPPYPGFHRDDWEGYMVRIEPDGSAWARASSHGHWQSCKEKDCEGDWIGTTGWTRVSRGSHAGHIPVRTELRLADRRQTPLLPGRDLNERTSTGDGLRLIPLETREHEPYRANGERIDPPWDKDAYRDPDSDGS
jgi:hypothetical protein